MNIKIVDVKPTKDFGYLCGLIIGDGYLNLTPSKNYNIAIESTKIDIVSKFREIASGIGFHTYKIYERDKTRKFPNGTIRTDKMYRTLVSSKQLYDLLRPHKQVDSRCSIPVCLTTKESKIGFLQGFVDAEGHINKVCKTIEIVSKHIEILQQVGKILESIEISYRIYPPYGKSHGSHKITIPKKSISKFKNIVGLRLERKIKDLKYILEVI